ncbi:MAG: glycoside hydrolase family 3 N-terminal domain-containing protein [Anaerolineales bacterium]
MNLTLEQAVGQKLMWSFAGKQAPSQEILAAIRNHQVGGITLFRPLNVENPEQVRALTRSLQEAARQAGEPPLLIAADQEGGQLVALGPQTTPLPGNLALGAAGSVELARQAGVVLGRELAAMGVNLNYAPCSDININPKNPVIGTRSFGEDPAMVARMAAAMLAGIQSAGVAATAKHFPGHGDTASDSHLGTPVIMHSRERIRQVELQPFRAAIQAGVRIVMSAHLAVPAFDDRDDLPATLSTNLLQGLLRQELGFEGLIATDAMDMQAIHQGAGLAVDAICAASAGADLLLLTSFLDQESVYTSLLQAARRGLLAPEQMLASAGRVLALKTWLAENAKSYPLDVVGCAEHREIAAEIARRSITLLRDEAGLLPLSRSPHQRLAVVMPQPVDLTPADTSSYVTPSLAQALRRYTSNVDEFNVSYSPSRAEISDVLPKLHAYDRVIIGTLNAYAAEGQAELVQAILDSGLPTIVTALRMPYDFQVFPGAPTYLCTYSILEPSMQALAQALWGEFPCTGRLPVSIPGLYAFGYRHGDSL